MSVSSQIVGTLTDEDNNSYDIIKFYNFGDDSQQYWLKQNWKCTKYTDGTSYPTEVFKVYDGNQANLDRYGYLYNLQRFISLSNGPKWNKRFPDGWRISTRDDIRKLESGIQGNINVGEYAGRYLKGKRTDQRPGGGEFSTNIPPRWDYHATNYGLDIYGFEAYPGGYADGNTFSSVGRSAFFWCGEREDFNTGHYVWGLEFHSSKVFKKYFNEILKNRFCSIRLVADGNIGWESTINVDSLKADYATNYSDPLFSGMGF
jgi:uncharacterized protein (TIGR02145 family)